MKGWDKMGNPAHLALVVRGAGAIRRWRKQNPNKTFNLSMVDLSEVNLSGANLSEANLNRTKLEKADLSVAQLTNALMASSELSEVS
jgi:uncharacterized protein YjbI with pentapeptide repeats